MSLRALTLITLPAAVCIARQRMPSNPTVQRLMQTAKRFWSSQTSTEDKPTPMVAERVASQSTFDPSSSFSAETDSLQGSGDLTEPMMTISDESGKLVESEGEEESSPSESNSSSSFVHELGGRTPVLGHSPSFHARHLALEPVQTPRTKHGVPVCNALGEALHTHRMLTAPTTKMQRFIDGSAQKLSRLIQHLSPEQQKRFDALCQVYTDPNGTSIGRLPSRLCDRDQDWKQLSVEGRLKRMCEELDAPLELLHTKDGMRRRMFKVQMMHMLGMFVREVLSAEERPGLAAIIAEHCGGVAVTSDRTDVVREELAVLEFVRGGATVFNGEDRCRWKPDYLYEGARLQTINDGQAISLLMVHDLEGQPMTPTEVAELVKEQEKKESFDLPCVVVSCRAVVVPGGGGERFTKDGMRDVFIVTKGEDDSLRVDVASQEQCDEIQTTREVWSPPEASTRRFASFGLHTLPGTLLAQDLQFVPAEDCISTFEMLLHSDVMHAPALNQWSLPRTGVNAYTTRLQNNGLPSAGSYSGTIGEMMLGFAILRSCGADPEEVIMMGGAVGSAVLGIAGYHTLEEMNPIIECTRFAERFNSHDYPRPAHVHFTALREMQERYTTAILPQEKVEGEPSISSAPVDLSIMATLTAQERKDLLAKWARIKGESVGTKRVQLSESVAMIKALLTEVRAERISPRSPSASDLEGTPDLRSTVVESAILERRRVEELKRRGQSCPPPAMSRPERVVR